MKTFLHYGLVLFLVVTISCGILAWVNTQTEPLIEENRNITRTNAKRSVFPEAHDFFEMNHIDLTFFKALSIENDLLGYIVEAVGKGYSGDIKTIISLNKDMTVNRIAVLEQTETPGLGTKITRPEFLSRFHYLRQNDIRLEKDGGYILNITGATISARAMANSIRETIERLEKSLEHFEEVEGFDHTLIIDDEAFEDNDDLEDDELSQNEEEESDEMAE